MNGRLVRINLKSENLNLFPYNLNKQTDKRESRYSTHTKSSGGSNPSTASNPSYGGVVQW